MVVEWKKTDSQVKKSLSVNVDVPNHLADQGQTRGAFMPMRVNVDLVIIMCNFLLQVGA
jgi:hypothetical protein